MVHQLYTMSTSEAKHQRKRKIKKTIRPNMGNLSSSTNGATTNFTPDIQQSFFASPEKGRDSEDEAEKAAQELRAMIEKMDARHSMDLPEPLPLPPKGPNPYLDGEKCLLCRKDRSDPEAARREKEERERKAREGPQIGLTPLPLWVCSDCRDKVDDEGDDEPVEEKAPAIPFDLASHLFEVPRSLPYKTDSEDDPAVSCDCQSCVERRELEEEEQRQAIYIQKCWIELNKRVHLIYSEALLADECSPIRAPTDKDCETIKELVHRLCVRDPHQLFLRLEAQCVDYVRDVKQALCKMLEIGYSTPCLAQEFVSSLLRDYQRLCSACRILAQFLNVLEKKHLRRFNLTWDLHNKHLFHSYVYMSDDIQQATPHLITQLRHGSSDTGSGSECPRVLKRLLQLDNEMSVVSVVWRDCQLLIDRYNESESIKRTRRQMLCEDWELFKSQRRLLENSVHNKKAVADNPNFHKLEFQTMKRLQGHPSLLEEDRTCPNCNVLRPCLCGECSINHYITCGLVSPSELSEVELIHATNDVRVHATSDIKPSELTTLSDPYGLLSAEKSPLDDIDLDDDVDLADVPVHLKHPLLYMNSCRRQPHGSTETAGGFSSLTLDVAPPSLPSSSESSPRSISPSLVSSDRLKLLSCDGDDIPEDIESGSDDLDGGCPCVDCLAKSGLTMPVTSLPPSVPPEVDAATCQCSACLQRRDIAAQPPPAPPAASNHVCSHAMASAALGSKAPLPLYPHTLSTTPGHCSQPRRNSNELPTDLCSHRAERLRDVPCRSDRPSHTANHPDHSANHPGHSVHHASHHTVHQSGHTTHHTGQQPTQKGGRGTAPLYDLHALSSLAREWEESSDLHNGSCSQKHSHGSSTGSPVPDSIPESLPSSLLDHLSSVASASSKTLDSNTPRSLLSLTAEISQALTSHATHAAAAATSGATCAASAQTSGQHSHLQSCTRTQDSPPPAPGPNCGVETDSSHRHARHNDSQHKPYDVKSSNCSRAQAYRQPFKTRAEQAVKSVRQPGSPASVLRSKHTTRRSTSPTSQRKHPPGVKHKATAAPPRTQPPPPPPAQLPPCSAHAEGLECPVEGGECTAQHQQKDAKHCDCCYCEFFGPQSSQPQNKQYQETRERLRMKLKKKHEQKEEMGSSPRDPKAPVTSDVDELLAFIEGDTAAKASSKSPAQNKANKKLKKKKKTEEKKVPSAPSSVSKPESRPTECKAVDAKSAESRLQPCAAGPTENPRTSSSTQLNCSAANRSSGSADRTETPSKIKTPKAKVEEPETPNTRVNTREDSAKRKPLTSSKDQVKDTKRKSTDIETVQKSKPVETKLKHSTQKSRNSEPLKPAAEPVTVPAQKPRHSEQVKLKHGDVQKVKPTEPQRPKHADTHRSKQVEADKFNTSDTKQTKATVNAKDGVSSAKTEAKTPASTASPHVKTRFSEKHSTSKQSSSEPRAREVKAVNKARDEVESRSPPKPRANTKIDKKTDDTITRNGIVPKSPKTPKNGMRAHSRREVENMQTGSAVNGASSLASFDSLGSVEDDDEMERFIRRLQLGSGQPEPVQKKVKIAWDSNRFNQLNKQKK